MGVPSMVTGKTPVLLLMCSDLIAHRASTGGFNL
jgi:hypothetical protein